MQYDSKLSGLLDPVWKKETLAPEETVKIGPHVMPLRVDEIEA